MMESTEDKETLLVEYQAAQDSAQFHDSLIWQVTNVLWVAGLILFGFILTQLGKPDLRILLTLLSILGLSFVVFAWFSALQFVNIKNQKYARCKDIEETLGMLQHRTLKFPKYFQRVIYAIIMILFIIAWIVLVVSMWLGCSAQAITP